MFNKCRNNIISIGLMSFALIGCFGLFDSGKRRVIAKYIILWIDIPQNQTQSEESETSSSSSAPIIDAYVYAVGHNDHYIIAKQHPTNGVKGGYKIDTSVINYYIIDIKRQSKYNDYTTIGPLQVNEFQNLLFTLKIENIQFDIRDPDNIYPTISLPDSLKRTPAY